MKKPFFARHALLVLIVVFFFVPFAMRGSRYAVQRMKNDVKDWLPADFPETKELEWFRQRFLGEQFVIISWDQCFGTEEDERFRKFVDGLFPEVPPSARPAGQPPQDYVDHNIGLYARSHMPESDNLDETFIGNRLSLYAGNERYFDWGGRKEKWLRSGRNDWVYITPKGELYQWTGNRSWPARLWRFVVRQTMGRQPVKGEFIAWLAPEDGSWYYEDPRRLNARLFKSVYSGPSVLSELTEPEGRLNLSLDEAHDRLRGVMFGPDEKQTCIIVTLTDAAKADPRALVGRGILGKRRGELLNIAEAAGIQVPMPPPPLPGFLAEWLLPSAPASMDPMLRLGGPPVDNAAIDEEGQITLVRLLGLSLAVGLGLSWICFRSVNITIMVFLVGGISAVTSVGIVYWTGSQLDAVLMSMPSLVYVLGISGAVHVVNYYRESVSDHGISTAPDNAVRLGLWPCTMAALTTSLGLISLSMSNIVPIRKFGCYSAIGVIATLFLLFTYLPAALEMWPPRRYLNRAAIRGGASPASAIERFLDHFWQGVGKFVISHYRLVACLCLIGLLAGSYGLTKIKTSVQLLKLFDARAKIIEDYEWLERHLGKLVPMEIVIRIHPRLFDPSSVGVELEEAVTHPEQLAQSAEVKPAGMNFLERMEVSKFVAIEIDRVFGESGAKQLSQPMLASTFAPDPPKAGTKRLETSMRSGFAVQLEKNRQSYVDMDFLHDDPDDGHELWRISLRLAALDGIDFGEFVQRVQRVVEPILLAYEYREAIVRRLPRDREDVPGFFLVGYQPEDPEEAASSGNEVPRIDPTLFARHLNRLLHNEGIRLKGVISTVDQLADVEPYDTIIVLADAQGITAEAMNATRALRFDARNHAFNPASDATARQRGQMVSAVYTGLVPIVYKAQRTLLTSLIQSTGLAFVMIAGVMIVLLRSPRAGLISMFPNVFPVVAIFGVMGLRRDEVDIGSMMTASVAMGVAVDDTIHFLSWFRKGLDEGLDRRRSILLAYRRVATAMTQTTAIGGIGLSIFAFSTFTPTQRFGVLMLALLVAALVGDLLFLPALLASSLGKVFDKGHQTTSERMSTIEKDGQSRSLTAAPHLDAHASEARATKTGKNFPTGLRKDDPHGHP